MRGVAFWGTLPGYFTRILCLYNVRVIQAAQHQRLFAGSLDQRPLGERGLR